MYEFICHEMDVRLLKSCAMYSVHLFTCSSIMHCYNYVVVYSLFIIFSLVDILTRVSLNWRMCSLLCILCLLLSTNNDFY